MLPVDATHFAMLDHWLTLAGFLFTLATTAAIATAETNLVVDHVWPIPRAYATGNQTLRLRGYLASRVPRAGYRRPVTAGCCVCPLRPDASADRRPAARTAGR